MHENCSRHACAQAQQHAQAALAQEGRAQEEAEGRRIEGRRVDVADAAAAAREAEQSAFARQTLQVFVPLMLSAVRSYVLREDVCLRRLGLGGRRR